MWLWHGKGRNVSENEELSNKLNKICSLIQGGERDIKKIAEGSSCKIEECVFNIKYFTIYCFNCTYNTNILKIWIF